MPHAFDTGLAAPQRTLVRNAVIAKLAELKVTSGLYFTQVVPLAAPFQDDGGELEAMLVDALGAKLPAALVALGDREFGGRTESDEWVGPLDVHVYAVSNHQRSTMARLEGDVVSAAQLTADPGVETALEHIMTRLAGTDLGVAGVQALRIRNERIALHAKEIVVWEQLYTAVVQTDVNRLRALIQKATELEADHNIPDGGTANPIVNAVSTIPP